MQENIYFDLLLVGEYIYIIVSNDESYTKKLYLTFIVLNFPISNNYTLIFNKDIYRKYEKFEQISFCSKILALELKQTKNIILR